MILPIRIILFLAAATLVGIGGMIAFMPHVVYGAANGGLPDDILLRSDIRSAGSLLLAFGICVFAAGLRMIPVRFALLVSAIAFLSYGMGRLLSLGLDGMPGPSIYVIAGLEWTLGLAALAGLFLLRPERPEN